MKELIERLVKATGPDQELDAQIWLAVTPGATRKATVIQSSKGLWPDYTIDETRDASGRLTTPPCYTAFIDAALTLLPEWASFELTRSAAGEPAFTRCRLWDWRRGPLAIDRDNEWKSDGNRPLVINICISALKARGETP